MSAHSTHKRAPADCCNFSVPIMTNSIADSDMKSFLPNCILEYDTALIECMTATVANLYLLLVVQRCQATCHSAQY